MGCRRNGCWRNGFGKMSGNHLELIQKTTTSCIEKIMNRVGRVPFLRKVKARKTISLHITRYNEGVHIFLTFSPVASANPGNQNLISLFTTLFQDSMEEYTYIAREAGLTWSITASNQGFEVHSQLTTSV